MEKALYKTSLLLRELIVVSQVSKTDFALCMNMTPSGLSKILTGSRLPVVKERTMFCLQAAHYFADLIFSHGCYIKLKKIFPVIYNFDSKNELTSFLLSALEYALDFDYSVENKKNLEYPDSEISYLSKKTILNTFCIIVSDFATNNRKSSLNYFSSLPFFEPRFSDIFSRVIVFNDHNFPVSFNHYFDLPTFESAYEEHEISIISKITKLHESLAINYWRTPEKISQAFLLLEDRFLLIFNMQFDGTPLMTFITHKGYLAIFQKHLMGISAKKISFTSEEALDVLKANPVALGNLLNQPADLVYNLIPTGFLLKENELAAANVSPEAQRFLKGLFPSVMNTETEFLIPMEALHDFCSTGKIFIPLSGYITIPAEKRIDYLMRLNRMPPNSVSPKTKIVYSHSLNAALLCFPHFNIIYLPKTSIRQEKFHCFESSIFSEIMKKEMADNLSSSFDFSHDLWKISMDELSSSVWDFEAERKASLK